MKRVLKIYSTQGQATLAFDKVAYPESGRTEVESIICLHTMRTITKRFLTDYACVYDVTKENGIEHHRYDTITGLDLVKDTVLKNKILARLPK